MDANDQRLIEGLFARIDRLVAIMEGKYCPETSGETWLRAEELLKLPQFRHRKGRVWLYELAKTSPDIMKRTVCRIKSGAPPSGAWNVFPRP